MRKKNGSHCKVIGRFSQYSLFRRALFFSHYSPSHTITVKKTWAKHIYISQLKRFPKRDTSCKWHKFRLDLKVSYDYYFLSPFSIHICIHIDMPVYDWRFISQANLNDRRKSQILNLLFVVNYVIFFSSYACWSSLSIALVVSLIPTCIVL